MSRWRGISGVGYSPDEFDERAAGLTFAGWQPRFVVLHNTAVPRLSDWHDVSGLQRMRGLERYYRDEQGWSGGPHLFVADDRIWEFTPLTQPGVHSPSWNAVSWGVETVGDYDREALPASVRLNLIRALAALYRRLGISPETMRLHKEDRQTTHKGCPGRHLADQRDAIVAEVKARLAQAA